MEHDPEFVWWWVVEGASPNTPAVEPGAHDIEVPDEIISWAVTNGAADDPDRYVLVTPEDEAGEVAGGIASRRGMLPAADMARLRDALAEQQQARREDADTQGT